MKKIDKQHLETIRQHTDYVKDPIVRNILKDILSMIEQLEKSNDNKKEFRVIG